jgi:hypothetical protein
MWLAQLVCAPQFFKIPKGLCEHTVFIWHPQLTLQRREAEDGHFLNNIYVADNNVAFTSILNVFSAKYDAMSFRNKELPWLTFRILCNMV